jgi:hypothetical protein
MPFDNFAGFIAQGAGTKKKPPKFAVEAAEAALYFERLLQNSKLPGMLPEFVAGRLDESQPPIPSPKLALQIHPYSPASVIEEVCRAVRTSGPRQCRNGVDYKANVLYIFRFFEFHGARLP